MKLTYKVIWTISLIMSFIAGYFFSNQQTADKTISLLDTKEQCMRVGSEVHNRISAEYRESDLDATVLGPEYTYNTSLDTCLYSSGSISETDGGQVIVQKWVMDSFTNEELLSFMSFDGEVTGLSVEEFDLQKEDLFTE